MPPVFSNKPKVCQKQLSLEETLSLTKFNALTESSLESNSANNLASACGDPNLATTFIKNVVHQVIRCGGDNIDINFFREMFPSSGTPTMVGTKRWYNHYVCDTNLNIYAAASASASTKGGAITFQVLKQFHGGSGAYSLPAKGYSIWDKDRMIEYIVTNVDTTTPWAHKVTVKPTDITVQGTIRVNTPYLVIPSRRVGGNSEKQITNALSTIGYSQEVRPLRVRKDWELEIDLLRGFLDKIQYAVIYDMQGNEMDSFDVYEAQQARLGVQQALNLASFIGTPTTNTALIQDDSTHIDQYYTGFYGLLPSIKYGNGVVYPFRASQGFDFEADGEPIFLWQDSQKRTSKFLVMHGLGWDFGTTNRMNKLVARTDAGKFQWEAYKRLGGMNGNGSEKEIEKLGLGAYKYGSFELDLKRINAFSDVRYAGSDYYSNLAIMMPKDGVKEQGKAINPIEFYQIGQNGWTGEYYESYVDNRKQTIATETIQGYSAESLAMAVHCPDLWVILDPIVDN